MSKQVCLPTRPFLATGRRRFLNPLLPGLVLLFAIAEVCAQSPLQVVTDNITYNVGDVVRLRVIPDGSKELSAADFFMTLRYQGDAKPVLERFRLPHGPKSALEGSYREAWKIPIGARTGRYEIDLAMEDPSSHKDVAVLARAASFAVHRKLLSIERIELDKTFYSSGDPVGCRVVLKNLTDQTLNGLRVEFSERYWPWIAQSSTSAGVNAFPIVQNLSLQPRKEVEVRSATAAVAKSVKETSYQQYAVVVWDQQRKTVYDIAFSALTFISPHANNGARPYPLQYVYPNLQSVDTTSYRQFSRRESNSPALQFDHSHTMYKPGDAAIVKFTLTNNTDRAWKDITIRANLRSLGSAEFANQVIGEHVDLKERGGRLEQDAKFTLPGDGPGQYRAVVEVSNSGGDVLASGQLELAANPHPKSILIFCAHEDDEGAHSGMIRAAVENHIPLRLVYFTSGDSGSCDRYYEHSCSPAEALNFGALRMEEARASLDHLGVLPENIYFLGLPDGGSGEIWRRHVDPANPFLSVLLASDHAPFGGLAVPNLPYARKPAVEAAMKYIRQFQPDVIYTGHPDERHVDHRTNNWFVVKAMQQLLHEGVIPRNIELRVDQVYGPGPQEHAPYQYEKHVLYVSPEARAIGQEAEWFYQSQSGNRELGKIRPLDELPREEIHWRVLDWMEHEGWNEKD